MTFAEKLVKLRKEKGLTQQQLARHVGVHTQQMGRYERGTSDPPIEVIKKMALTLGVSADELLFEEADGVAHRTIRDKELLDQFAQVATRPTEDRLAAKIVLGSLILKKKFVGLLPSPSQRKAWETRTRKVLTSLRAHSKGISEKEIFALTDDALKSIRAHQRG